jgi:epoxide hydrolase
MNADLRRYSTEVEPARLEVPQAAWQRLRLRLGQASATGEAWSASAAYGVAPDTLSALVDYWCDDFEPDESALPGFETEVDGTTLDFMHLRSGEPAALPLLLLHGYSGSRREFDLIAESLAASGCHVVCPSLAFRDVAGAARACSALLQRLGYQRYAVHGSDLGANVALELAAREAERVAGLHVTALPAYPDAQEALTSEEKSQLARLTELRHELLFQLPESPIEDLAFALARLEDLGNLPINLLLGNLTLRWALGGSSELAELYRTTRLAAAPASRVPVALHDFPLATPSLRRFAERKHRVVEWREHAQGGPMPALEQPQLLLESLRTFCDRLR